MIVKFIQWRTDLSNNTDNYEFYHTTRANYTWLDVPSEEVPVLDRTWQ